MKHKQIECHADILAIMTSEFYQFALGMMANTQENIS
jgi:hypothetical protein